MHSNSAYHILLVVLVFSELNYFFNTVNGKIANGIFESKNFWDVIDKPVMANGHIGFVPYGESIYMNGLYNGYKGESHRARIPNNANIQFEPCNRETDVSSQTNHKCSYALDIFNGIFRTQAQLSDGRFTVEHIQYAHRFYDMALVNHIRLKRNAVNKSPSNGKFSLKYILLENKRSLRLGQGLIEVIKAHFFTFESHFV